MSPTTTSNTTRTRAKMEESMDTLSVQGEQPETSADSNGSSVLNAETVARKLKSVGVDTDQMASAAKDQASELQRMLTAEIQAHPMRTLGIAAAIGVFVGLLTAR